MGSNPQGFIDVVKAAEILGCESDQIVRLAHGGTFRHRLEEGLVYQPDVEALKDLGLGTDIPAQDVSRRVRFLEAKVAKLEESINLIFEVNGMRASPFSRMSDAQLTNLYGTLVRDLEEDEWPVDRMLSYCEIFIRIGEEEAHRINEALEIENSWHTFYDLLLRVNQYVARHPDFDVNLELQRIYELLSVGRKNLRAVARYFIEKSGDLRTSQELLAALASNDIDQFDDLARHLKGISRPGHLALA